MKRILKFNDYKNCLFKNEIILKWQQRFESEGHCVYTEEVKKIALSSNNDKRLQTFDRIRTYPYGTNAFKVCKNEMLSKYIWLILIIIRNGNKTEHNSMWPYIPDHPCRILIIGGSGFGKTNALLNVINNQPDSDKIYLYAKDQYGEKYQFLINKRQSTVLKHFNDLKAFIG